MTADVQLMFPSEPQNVAAVGVIQAVADGGRSDEEWRRFVMAVQSVALWNGGQVDPADVRAHLTVNGELVVSARRLSAFYLRAKSTGLLTFDHWGVSTDTAGRNAGKPARHYRTTP